MSTIDASRRSSDTDQVASIKQAMVTTAAASTVVASATRREYVYQLQSAWILVRFVANAGPPHNRVVTTAPMTAVVRR
ncbi:MAG: hypothetical protein ACKO2Q_09395 [Actinomycetota bacterium]